MIPIVAVVTKILSVLGSIWAFISGFRKLTVFVIAGVIWTVYLIVVGYFVQYGETFLNSYDEATIQLRRSMPTTAECVAMLEKASYWFPVEDAFQCIGLLLSVSLAVVALRWILRVWEAVPFKGASGS